MKMILPPDWDEPSEGNAGLCSRFLSKSTKLRYGDMPYRLYEPMAADTKIPLVIYLHGADAAGSDNGIHLSMHDVGTFPVRDEVQRKHPCYVLAPQYGEMMHWSMRDIKEGLWTTIEDTVNMDKRIDRDRIYVYGYSAGGIGALGLIKEHPDYFAAAVSVCGSTGITDIENILKTPLWMIHAADDKIVRCSYRKGGNEPLMNLGSHDIYEWYKENGGKVKHPSSDIRYTEYPEGYMKEHYGVNPHCSWVALSDPANRNIWEWMFSHTLTGGII